MSQHITGPWLPACYSPICTAAECRAMAERLADCKHMPHYVERRVADAIDVLEKAATMIEAAEETIKRLAAEHDPYAADADAESDALPFGPTTTEATTGEATDETSEDDQ